MRDTHALEAPGGVVLEEAKRGQQGMRDSNAGGPDVQQRRASLRPFAPGGDNSRVALLICLEGALGVVAHRLAFTGSRNLAGEGATGDLGPPPAMRGSPSPSS